MTPMPLGLFVQKLQPKVSLGRNDILFAYFVVEAKSKKKHKGKCEFLNDFPTKFQKLMLFFVQNSLNFKNIKKYLHDFASKNMKIAFNFNKYSILRFLFQKLCILKA